MKKLLVAGFVLLSGCTLQKYEIPGEIHTFPIKMKPLSQILTETDVQCQSADACPEQVGEIVGIIKSNGVITDGEVCTGFLVAPDIIATNSHCIPKQFKEGETNCSDSLGIKFPAGNGGSPEIHVCSQIIEYSKIDPKQQIGHADWAFFRIDSPTKRKPFQISRAGFPNDTAVNVYSVDPIAKESTAGRLRLKHCRATQGSLLEPNYDYDFSDVALIMGQDCKMIPGNSGSPVVTGNGQVPVILFATNFDAKKSLESVAQELGVGMPDRADSAAYVTNYACLDLPPAVPAPQSPPQCAPDRRKELAQAGRNRLDKTLTATPDHELDQALQTFTQTTLSPGQFEAKRRFSTDSSKNRDGTFDLKVNCLLPKDQWPAGSYSLNGSILSMSYSIPVFKYGIVLDKYLRATAQRLGESYNKIDFTIDVSRVGDQDSLVGEETVTGSLTEQLPVITHWCGSSELQNPLKVSDK